MRVSNHKFFTKNHCTLYSMQSADKWSPVIHPFLAHTTLLPHTPSLSNTLPCTLSPSHTLLPHTLPPHKPSSLTHPPSSPVSCTSPVTFPPQTYSTNMAALSWAPLNRVAMWYSRVPTNRMATTLVHTTHPSLMKGRHTIEEGSLTQHSWRAAQRVRNQFSLIAIHLRS